VSLGVRRPPVRSPLTWSSTVRVFGRAKIGAMAGVPVPLQACEHFYVVTEPMAGLPRHAPVIRVPRRMFLFSRRMPASCVVGFFEPKAKPGPLTARRRISNSELCGRLGPDRAKSWRWRARECPRWDRPGSIRSSTGLRASRPTTATCSGISSAAQFLRRSWIQFRRHPIGRRRRKGSRRVDRRGRTQPRSDGCRHSPACSRFRQPDLPRRRGSKRH